MTPLIRISEGGNVVPRTAIVTSLLFACSLLAACSGPASQFDSPTHVGNLFLNLLARGEVERAHFYTCEARHGDHAQRGASDPGLLSTPLADDVGGRPAHIVNDNPFGEPDPDGDVTVEGTVEDVPYLVVLTQFDDGLWCVTEATLDDAPIVTDGQMPLDQFE